MLAVYCAVLYQEPQASNRNTKPAEGFKGHKQRTLQQPSRILYHALTASWHTIPNEISATNQHSASPNGGNPTGMGRMNGRTELLLLPVASGDERTVIDETDASWESVGQTA
jgi:hypothetical protein